MYKYGVLTDTNEYYRVDSVGIPYKYVDGQWKEDLSLGGIYSGDIPTKHLTEEEVWARLNLQK